MTLVLILLALIAFIVLSTTRLKLHPFLALLAAALIAGFAYQVPTAEIVKTVTGGFGSILGYIGIVIVLGTIIGVILERSGAAITMAESVIRLLGERFPTLTMSIIGYLVSIPVESLVGGAVELLVAGLAASVEAGHAEAGGQAEHAVLRRQRGTFEAFAEFFRKAASLLLGGVGQEQEEFFPAQARHAVAATGIAAQQVGGMANDLVAEGVPIAVVDVLEVIQVDHQQAQRLRLASDACEFHEHQLVEFATIEQAAARRRG